MQPSTPTDHRRPPMPRPGRNDPCPCGSGRKVKRCCGERRGPSQDELARAHVAQLARQAVPTLASLSDRALDHLWEGLIDLPGVDYSLLVGSFWGEET